VIFAAPSFSQGKALDDFLADSSMQNATLSFCVIDATTGKAVTGYNKEKSLAPASVMKLLTTAVALELLGPDYTFTTSVFYSGRLNNKSGRLSGDIIIKGGGDPALGSPYFTGHYGNFPDNWVSDIQNKGIKKISGRILSDDSYYDFQPVPRGWTWEDIGNYYGAGVYGISVFDNTYMIHFRTGNDSSDIQLTGISPALCGNNYTNRLSAFGRSDQGYVFSAPYNNYSWYDGTIPVNKKDFILKASISDPPLLLAQILSEKLEDVGIQVAGEPATSRITGHGLPESAMLITETESPPLKDIIKVLNHESVNLYAENLLKELGKAKAGRGTTAGGIDIVKDFLESAGINNKGMFIEDGSGLSPANSINAEGLAELLVFMKDKGKYFNDYFASLPAAGRDGTLKNYFHEDVFDGRMAAKSGSMTRVRSYAGYLDTFSGKTLAFAVIVNDFSGPSQHIVSCIESLLEELIIKN